MIEKFPKEEVAKVRTFFNKPKATTKALDGEIKKLSDEKFVDFLYRVLLDRKPEENGFAVHVDSLKNAGCTRELKAEQFLNCVEYKSKKGK
jgi:hypothetical protein